MKFIVLLVYLVIALAAIGLYRWLIHSPRFAHLVDDVRTSDEPLTELRKAKRRAERTAVNQAAEAQYAAVVAERLQAELS